MAHLPRFTQRETRVRRCGDSCGDRPGSAFARPEVDISRASHHLGVNSLRLRRLEALFMRPNLPLFLRRLWPLLQLVDPLLQLVDLWSSSSPPNLLLTLLTAHPTFLFPTRPPLPSWLSASRSTPLHSTPLILTPK